jgi:hypothetical protein
MQLGVPIETALWRVAKTVQTDEFNFLIVALSIQRDTGGNLAETLANLSALLRARQQLRLKIRAFTSEARATMMIMAGLPFLVGGGLFLISPDYIGPLFTTPTGQMVAAAPAAAWARHLHHEQDRDHQGLRRHGTRPLAREELHRLVAVAAFVRFWASGWRSPGAADRGAAAGAAHPPHEDAQRAGARAKPSPRRLDRLMRRSPTG